MRRADKTGVVLRDVAQFQVGVVVVSEKGVPKNNPAIKADVRASFRGQRRSRQRQGYCRLVDVERSAGRVDGRTKKSVRRGAIDNGVTDSGAIAILLIDSAANTVGDVAYEQSSFERRAPADYCDSPTVSLCVVVDKRASFEARNPT